MSQPLFQVKDLQVEFDTFGGVVHAVRGVSFEVEQGQTLAIVGESGCGKSVSVQAAMGLLPMPPARIMSGSVLLGGQQVLTDSGKEYRGRDIGMIFQDPMSALNPTMTIGDQIAEPLIVHRGLSKADARRRVLELLDLVRIPEGVKRVAQYPFEFSGGMLQRVMIAMAIACKPKVLIADEPTTALDVTIQAQILELLQSLQKETGMALVLITHDLGVVARVADHVAVMYAGKIVERGTVDEVFYQSGHPYTLGLKQAMPSVKAMTDRAMQPIAGSPPDLFSPPVGCAYGARCPYAMAVCKRHDSPSMTLSNSHSAHCWLHHELAPAGEAKSAVGGDA
ncbi:MAG: ABC transporter ATP-binding protein [Pseudohongiellaceae bacterium]|nr:ABC transporter ATP-binding protein [Pseudohongiellaceae bacterium]